MKTLRFVGQKRKIKQKGSWMMIWLDMPIEITRYYNGTLDIAIISDKGAKQ